jgi:hypothetical protein
MYRLIKSVKHIQIKQIAFSPKLYEALITYEPYDKHPTQVWHPTQYDESDDIEYQKTLINKLIGVNWFYTDYF